METGPERVTVASETPPKPKQTRKPRTKRGAIKPEHVEAWTVQVFSLIAMLRNAQHWAVQDVNVEVRPWSPAAADLINEHVPADFAEKAITANAAVAVVVGLGTMIYVRTAQDAAIRQQRRLEGQAARRDELKRQEGVPPRSPNGPAPDQSDSQRTATVPGTGAAPTWPGPISGINPPEPGLR